MANFNEIENAYRQNMFARGDDKKETLVQLINDLDDTTITGNSSWPEPKTNDHPANLIY